MRIDFCTVIVLSGLFLLCDRADAVDSPQWWKETRAIYASFDLSGAGGPLMKFPSDDIKKKLETVVKLPGNC